MKAKMQVPSGLFWLKALFLAFSWHPSHDLSIGHGKGRDDSYMKTLIIWIRSSLLWLHLNLITSIKSVWKNSHIGTGGMTFTNEFWGGYNQIHYSRVYWLMQPLLKAILLYISFARKPLSLYLILLITSHIFFMFN
jgi:hypothetical protein